MSLGPASHVLVVIALLAPLFSAGVGTVWNINQVQVADDEIKFDELNIKQVMKLAMTQGLCKKVIKKKGTPEDKDRLLKLCKRLSKLQPPKGDDKHWKKLTKQLVKSCEDVIKAKKGAEKQLQKAANCSACHRPHRPKK